MFQRLTNRAALRYLRRVRTPASVQRAAALLRPGVGRIPRDHILTAQADALRRLVRYAAGHAPFYREQFRRSGVNAWQVSSLDDLAELPLTDSDDLHQWQLFRCVKPEQVGAIFTSAGTSGPPKRIDYSFEDVEVIANAGAVGLRIFHPGPMRAAIVMPMRHGLWIGWRQALQQLERAGALALPLGAEDPQQTLQWLQWFEPNVISSSPSYLMKVTEEARRADFRPKVDRIALGAEPLKPDQQEHLSSYWRADVFNVYGTTEAGVGLGFSLPNGSALCFLEHHLLPEIVDPDTGKPADEGELLLTTLTRRGMPLLRYRVGDRAKWVDVDSDMPFRFLEVLGRTDELIVIAGSNISARVLADLAHKTVGEPQKVAVHVDRPNQSDRLRIQVAGAVDQQRLREEIFEQYPRLRTHDESGTASMEIQAEADLEDQLKPLAVQDHRED